MLRKGKSNPMWGRTHTEETKRKMSVAAKNRRYTIKPVISDKCRHARIKSGSVPILQFTVTGKLLAVYPSIKTASVITGISESTIRRGLSVECGLKLAKNFIWAKLVEHRDNIERLILESDIDIQIYE